MFAERAELERQRRRQRPRPSLSADRYWPAEEALRRYWLDPAKVASCIDCGSVVGDMDAHDRHHDTIDSNADQPPPARQPAALTTGDHT